MHSRAGHVSGPALFLFVLLGLVHAQVGSPTLNGLSAFRSAVDPNDATLINWGSGDPCLNSWIYVACSGDDSRVLEIDVPVATTLAGELPDEAWTLPHLEKLNLFFAPALSGSLKSWDLPNLKELVITNSQVNGAIPDFSSSPLLELVYLPTNQLSGPIPYFDLPLLETLFLSENSLDGELPGLEGLPNLRQFAARDNGLVGGLPSLSNNTMLSQFWVGGNNLCGPSFLGGPALTDVDLDNNPLINSPCPNLALLPISGTTYWDSLSACPYNFVRPELNDSALVLCSDSIDDLVITGDRQGQCVHENTLNYTYTVQDPACGAGYDATLEVVNEFGPLGSVPIDIGPPDMGSKEDLETLVSCSEWRAEALVIEQEALTRARDAVTDNCDPDVEVQILYLDNSINLLRADCDLGAVRYEMTATDCHGNVGTAFVTIQICAATVCPTLEEVDDEEPSPLYQDLAIASIGVFALITVAGIVIRGVDWTERCRAKGPTVDAPPSYSPDSDSLSVLSPGAGGDDLPTYNEHVSSLGGLPTYDSTTSARP